MKKSIYLFVLASGLCAQFAFGQKDSTLNKKIVFGVNLNAFLVPRNYGIEKSLDFTLDKGHSLFFIGIACGRKIEIENDFLTETYNPSFQFHGVHSGYQINPNRNGKVFDFYFEFNNNILRYSASHEVSNYYWTDIKKKTEIQVQNFLGFGFKIKIPANFYFNIGVGYGILYSISTAVHLNNTSHTNTYRSFEGVVKVGMGYRFNNKK